MPAIILIRNKKKRAMGPPPPPSKKKTMPAPKRAAAEPPPPPPGLDDSATDPDAADEGNESAHTVGPEDVDYSSGDLCGSCEHMGEDGNCSKYGFPVSQDGHCEAGYEPKGGEPGEQEQPEAA